MLSGMRRRPVGLVLAVVVLLTACLTVPSAASARRPASPLLVTDLSKVSDDEQLLFAALQGLVTNFAAVSTSTDNVFSSSTAAQIAAQTPSLTGSVAAGYTGTITVGLAV